MNEKQMRFAILIYFIYREEIEKNESRLDELMREHDISAQDLFEIRKWSDEHFDEIKARAEHIKRSQDPVRNFGACLLMILGVAFFLLVLYIFGRH